LSAECPAWLAGKGAARGGDVIRPGAVNEGKRLQLTRLAARFLADVGLILYNPDYSENVRMCLPNELFEFVMAGLLILTSPLIAISEIVE
jgi:hypothetical protein